MLLWQNEVTMYPDLIKLKLALDNGEVLGIETTGYLNSHEERKLPKVKNNSKEGSKRHFKQKLEIVSQNLAVIPAEFRTEKFFVGNLKEK